MLINTFWIKKNEEFQRVYQKRQYLNNNYYSICYLKNNLDHPRFGIVVTSKRFKTAVQRNRIKRQLRPILKSLDFIKGYDIVIVVKEAYLQLDFKNRVSNIETLLKKIK